MAAAVASTPPAPNADPALPGIATVEASSAMAEVAPLGVAVQRPAESRPVVTPLAPRRYEFRFTGDTSTRDKLRRAQDLLRHAIPDGNEAAIFDRALTALLDQLEKRKAGATSAPRPPREASPGSRPVPATVRREVWTRDGGRCAFVGAGGHRCGTRAFLEYHHVIPWAAGGEATAANVELRCRAHNGYEAERYYGIRCEDLRRAEVGDSFWNEPPHGEVSARRGGPCGGPRARDVSSG